MTSSGPLINLVTDSTVAFADSSVATRPNLTILPLTIHFGTRSYLEKHGDSWDQLRSDLSGKEPLPVVASPSVEAFVSTFDYLGRRTNNILCLLSSNRLCRAVRNAKIAAEQFTGRMNISVVDSLTTSAGLGFLVSEAAKISDGVASLEEVVRQVRFLLPRLYAVFFVEDLAYLQRTGRVSHSQVLLGEMLGIKPFLSLEEGGIVPLEKVRSGDQAVEKLLEFIGEFGALQRLAVVYDLHDPSAHTTLLLQRIQETFPDCPLTTCGLSASVASIFGPHATGIIAFDAAPHWSESSANSQ
jgi:DegV family protein with EDD domain